MAIANRMTNVPYSVIGRPPGGAHGHWGAAEQRPL